MSFKNLHNWFTTQSTESSMDHAEFVHPADRFGTIIEIERMRSDRTGTAFSLVVFTLPMTKDFETELSQFLEALEPRLRATDHIGLMEEEQVAVLLCDSTEAGTWTFVEKMMEAWKGKTPPRLDVYRYPTYQPPTAGKSDHQSESQKSDTSKGRTVTINSPLPTLAKLDYVGVRLKNPPALARSAQTFNRLNDDSNLRLMSVLTRPVEADISTKKVQPLEILEIQALPKWKRFMDVVGATLGLVGLSPVMLLTAALIKMTSPGPILFKQAREGLGGKPFTIYKFRTMQVDAEAKKGKLRQYSEQDGPAFKLKNDPRITPIGRYLRKTCIDELPQIWNVLKGEMTLVGPRPLDCKESVLISGWKRRRLLVTPGLTCIWQVHGKSKVSFTEWMRMDIRYMNGRSIGRDSKLVAETMLAVVTHKASQ